MAAGLSLSPSAATNSPANGLFFQLKTNPLPRAIVPPPSNRTNQPPLILNLTPPSRRLGGKGMPAPGVYETKPFACIVVVPGPFPDDKMAKGRYGSDAPLAMPSIEPDLRFIPRNPAKR